MGFMRAKMVIMVGVASCARPVTQMPVRETPRIVAPHRVQVDANGIGCPRAESRLPIGAGWRRTGDETMVTLSQHRCRAWLVVRASRRVEGDFEALWAEAARVEPPAVRGFVTPPPEALIRLPPQGLQNFDEERRAWFQRDQLASHVCSYLLVIDASCPGDIAELDNMRRPSAALRPPDAPPKPEPVHRLMETN